MNPNRLDRRRLVRLTVVGASFAIVLVCTVTTVRGVGERIHDIQGAAHISPMNGMAVSDVEGIVTAEVSNGFYMQDPLPDASDATSEGIFVFTASAPPVNVGDSVSVDGTVTEFRPGGASSANLTTTEITLPTVAVLSTGNPFPAPVIVGTGGRIPPSLVIEDDATGSVETSGVFDPAIDGIDFYESLEGMRVQVNDAVVVGPTNPFGEIPIIGDNGANAGLRSVRAGLAVRANDFNPERILLDDRFGSLPAVNVGDLFATPVVGVLDYSFGNFKLQVTSAVTTVSGGLTREVTAQSKNPELAIATFNVLNLDPADGSAKFEALASVIVNNLRSPDIIAVEEVQDNNGAVNNGVTDASVTYGTLISAIQGAGGPLYQFRQIDPANNQDGGEPGGNIRVGFLFRDDRDLLFIDRPGGDATTPTGVVADPTGPRLTLSPGRIDPANPAFTNSRKPLVGEFQFRRRTLFVIANHFNSKSGDDPLFGRFQPPVESSQTQRLQQAAVVNNFVDSILALDPDADILVLGDLNDFEFSATLATLKGGVLTDLVETLPANERYSFVFDGNSQVLDHILVSSDLRGVEYDIVHVNAEFVDRVSDHDPQVARFKVRGRPDSKKKDLPLFSLFLEHAQPLIEVSDPNSTL